MAPITSAIINDSRVFLKFIVLNLGFNALRFSYLVTSNTVIFLFYNVLNGVFFRKVNVSIKVYYVLNYLPDQCDREGKNKI